MPDRPSPSQRSALGPSLSRSAGEGQEGQRRPAWLVLGGAFGAFTLSAALMHSYPVYLVAFIADFGWSRAETSIAYSVSQLVGGASSPLVGYLVDRLGSRRLLLLGGGLLVAGLLGSAFISTLWQIVVLYGIVMTIEIGRAHV